ncbi:MAG: carboxypeptidase regulatory-like domain-containing protein [Longimicrobiales bacterium]
MAAAFGLLAPAHVHGQRVLGKVVSAADGEPVRFALVTVRGDGGTPVGSAMADGNGNFAIGIGGVAGRLFVTGEQIGFATEEVGPVSLQEGNDAFVRLSLGVQVLDVGGVTVTVTSEAACGSDPGNATLVDQLWEEASKSLRLVEWAGENADVGFEVMMRETDYLPNGRTVQDQQEGLARGSGNQPFMSADHETLVNEGFVLQREGGRQFLGPDASYLLSPAFLDTHCLTWQGPSDDGARVSLFFKPRPSRTQPDIAGTIWLDATTGGLSEVSFDYVNIAFGTSEAVAKGGMTFGQLTSGEWLVDDWSINTPRIGVRPRQLGYGGQDTVVVGFRERSGTILRAWTGDGAAIAAAAGDTLSDQVEVVNVRPPRVEVIERPEVVRADSGTPGAESAEPTVTVFGSIRDADTGDPLAGVEVALANSGLETVTDEEGAFAFPTPPVGVEMLTMRHLAYGEQAEEIEIPSEGGLELVVRLEVLPVELAGITAEGVSQDEFETSVAGTRFDGLGRTEIEAMLPRVTNFGQLLRAASIPGLTVSERMFPYGAMDMPTMGLCVATNRMQRGVSGCAMVEVYINDVKAVDAAIQLQALDPKTISRFQLIPALEAGAQYGTGSTHGVLLIYTRGN